MAIARRLVLLLLAVAVCAAPAHAAVIVYTNQSAFLAALSGSPYTETFEGLTPGLAAGPINFSGSGFAYTATSGPSANEFLPYTPPGGADQWLGTNFSEDNITFAFTSGSPRAVGGFFYVSDIVGNPISGNVIITAFIGSTPTSFTLVNPGFTSFAGFISDGGPFTSLVTSPTSPTIAWGNVNDLTVAVAVPEPASLTLLGLGLVGMGVRRWRPRNAT